MTKEERWRAAIEEAKPLLESLKAIRDKHKLYSIHISAHRYEEMEGPFSQIQVNDDYRKLSLGDLWLMSYGGGEWREPIYSSLLIDEKDIEEPEDMEEEVE